MMLDACLDYSKKMVVARKQNNHSYKRNITKIRMDEKIVESLGQILLIKNTIKSIKNYDKQI